jgi:hypothetical protein
MGSSLPWMTRDALVTIESKMEAKVSEDARDI